MRCILIQNREVNWENSEEQKVILKNCLPEKIIKVDTHRLNPFNKFMTVANPHHGRTVGDWYSEKPTGWWIVSEAWVSSRWVFPWLKVILFQTFSWADKTFDESDFDDEAYYAALGTRPPLNMEELDETYQKVIELFSVCTNEDPKDRPSAAHIVEALEVFAQWSHIHNYLSFKYGSCI